MVPVYSKYANHWQINNKIAYLTHGTFGATPITILNKQKAFIDELEYNPMHFTVDKMPELIKDSKNSLADFVGTNANNIFFVNNTTTGVNAILNSQKDEGKEWLTTNHNYGACIHALKIIGAEKKCVVKIATIDYPNTTDEIILSSIEAQITSKTNLIMIDYITSATAVIFPIKKIVDLVHSKNIKILVDAAHAPGMVDFNLDDLNVDYFIANCHKWICSPKGSAFVYVHPRNQKDIRPLIISHYNDTAENTEAHWSNQFYFDGTHDYSAFFCVKDAIEYMPTIINGTWNDIKKHNHQLVWDAGNKIANALEVSLPVKENMVGAILNIPMPDGNIPSMKFMSKTDLNNILFEEYKIEVPVFNFPAAPKQWLRISAQLYNSMEQYDYLIASLKKIFK